MGEQCSCEKWYTDHAGVALCMQNKHGRGHGINDRYQSRGNVETEITVSCDICDSDLSFKTVVDGGVISVRMLPHVCAIEEPAVEPELKIVGGRAV